MGKIIKTKWTFVKLCAPITQMILCVKMIFEIISIEIQILSFPPENSFELLREYNQRQIGFKT